MRSAAEVEEEAGRWLMRQENPGWVATDDVALEAWLDAAPEHRAAYYRLEHGWRRVERLAALRPAAPRRPTMRRRPMAWAPIAMAASLLVAVAAGFVGFKALEPRGEIYATPIGGHSTVPLIDGSRVELNTATKIRTAVTSKSRTIWLDQGEAFFEVAHDKTRPFVVYAGDRKITAVGTKFSVRRFGDQVKVAVLEGRVRVEAVRPSEAVKPELASVGDVVLAKGPAILVTPQPIEDVNQQLSWRDGRLAFRQTTLAEAAAEFNRYNRTQIEVTDPAAAAFRIGGSFEAENVEGFAELLQQSYGLKVTRVAGVIKISA
jgi:transmembrane sensor